MNDNDLSRREFLQRTMVLGAAIGAGSILTSCGQDTGTADDMAAEPVALDCSDTSALTEVELQTREGLQYVEQSVMDGQSCEGCLHFQPPAEAGTCGTCALVAGSINPGGWCASWAEKTT